MEVDEAQGVGRRTPGDTTLRSVHNGVRRPCLAQGEIQPELSALALAFLALPGSLFRLSGRLSDGARIFSEGVRTFSEGARMTARALRGGGAACTVREAPVATRLAGKMELVLLLATAPALAVLVVHGAGTFDLQVLATSGVLEFATAR